MLTKHLQELLDLIEENVGRVRAALRREESALAEQTRWDRQQREGREGKEREQGHGQEQGQEQGPGQDQGQELGQAQEQEQEQVQELERPLRVTSHLLSWGPDLPSGLNRPWDVILCSDLIYFRETFGLLLETWRALAARNKGVKILLAHKVCALTCVVCLCCVTSFTPPHSLTRLALQHRYHKEKIFFHKASQFFDCQDLDASLIPRELAASSLSLMLFTLKSDNDSSDI